jgi:hypothetical protein
MTVQFPPCSWCGETLKRGMAPCAAAPEAERRRIARSTGNQTCREHLRKMGYAVPTSPWALIGTEGPESTVYIETSLSE